MVECCDERELLPFHLDIIYRPKGENSAAGALSRNFYCVPYTLSDPQTLHEGFSPRDCSPHAFWSFKESSILCRSR